MDEKMFVLYYGIISGFLLYIIIIGFPGYNNPYEETVDQTYIENNTINSTLNQSNYINTTIS